MLADNALIKSNCAEFRHRGVRQEQLTCKTCDGSGGEDVKEGTRSIPLNLHLLYLQPKDMRDTKRSSLEYIPKSAHARLLLPIFETSRVEVWREA